MQSRTTRIGLLVWASPWTLVGLLLGLLGLLTGGGMQRVGLVLEFHGGIVARLLRFVPIPAGASAITLGHAIIARTLDDLDRCRQHELVHVRQYERWGLAFVPLYFLSSLAVLLRGGNPYLDNVFEKEAYSHSPIEDSP